MLAWLFGDERNAEMITERCGWSGRCAENTSTCDLLVLTCIHKMCRRSCPVTPRLGEGPLFPLLLKK